MKKIYFTLFLSAILISFNTSVYAQSWQWAKKAGGTQADQSESVAVDHMGHVYIVGKFYGTASFGSNSITSSGSRDIFLAKYDSLGNVIWVKKAGGTLNDEGLAVSCDYNGNVSICGHFRQHAVFDNDTVFGADIENCFVAKYASSGNLLWVRNATGPGKSIGKGLECDVQGNVIVSGYYQDTCSFGNNNLISPGFKNVFIAKYDPVGTLKWISYGGGLYDTWASSVSTDDHLNSYITGAYKDTAVFGSNSIVSFGGYDVFLVKYDSAGNCCWAVHGGGTSDDYGNGLRVDPLNNIAVTGSFFDTVNFSPAPSIISNGNKDGFVAYYNPSGNCLWARNMGGLQSDKGIDVDGDKDGNIYVTGYIDGIAHFNSITDTSYGEDDIFIAKYDHAGNILYADLAGSSSNDYGKGIAVDMPGVAYVSGDFWSTAHFSGTTLSSYGDRDSYVAKYYDGSPVFALQPHTQHVCAGDTVYLIVQMQGSGPFSYLWFDEAGSLMGAVDSMYHFIPADTSWSGKYFCVVSNSQGSVTSDTAMIFVWSHPQIDLGTDHITPYDTTLIIDAGSGFSSYLWSTGDTTQTISVVTSQLIAFMIYDYSLTVTNTAGCSGSDTIQISWIPEGIEESYGNNAFAVYPNPAGKTFFIKIYNPCIQTISLYTPTGELLRSIEQQEVQANRIRIDCVGWPKGIYFIKLQGEEFVGTEKVVIY